MLFALVLANIDGRSSFFTRGDKIVQIFQRQYYFLNKGNPALRRPGRPKYLNNFVAPRRGSGLLVLKTNEMLGVLRFSYQHQMKYLC